LTYYNKFVIVGGSREAVNILFEVHFYKDKLGRQPIKEFLNTLKEKAKTNKDARVQYEKILKHHKKK